MPVQAIISRVQQILLSPKAAWAAIDAEAVDVQGLYKSYIAPLAAIPAVATFLGLSLFGSGLFRLSFGAALGEVLGSYILSLVAVYVFAWIIDYLAPQFGAQRNFKQAFKVAAYSPTAFWVAGIFGLIPPIAGIIGLLGALYTFYLVFLGLPALMKPPEDKGTAYSAVAILVGIVLGIVIGILMSRLFMPTVVIPVH
jgi:Yip1 domain